VNKFLKLSEFDTFKKFITLVIAVLFFIFGIIICVSVLNHSIFSSFKNDNDITNLVGIILVVVSFLFSYAFIRLLFKEEKVELHKTINHKNDKNKISDVEKEKRAERRVNYANRTNDMRQIKGQQWLIVYYCLLLFAGIVGLTSVLDKIEGVKNWNEIGALLLIMALLIPFFGIFAIYKNQKILKADRIETLAIEHKFYTGAEYHKKSISPFYVTYWFHWQYWLPFKVSIIIGAIFTIFFLKERFKIGWGLNNLVNDLSSHTLLIILLVLAMAVLIIVLVNLSKKKAIDKYHDLLFFR